jgi:2-C-methyl-D-erythritol 2,4-cyclodiphosphate synthase
VRIGTGYDIHRFEVGRRLVLGGVELPWDMGLAGHSDADVVTHALMDALLGAAALGDLGAHFPDTDARYRGASSLSLLEAVGKLLAERGFRVANVDVTVLAQVPRLQPYVERMRDALANAMALPVDRVSVKATTTDRLGPIGQGEAVAAQAVALLE